MMKTKVAKEHKNYKHLQTHILSDQNFHLFGSIFLQILNPVPANRTSPDFHQPKVHTLAVKHMSASRQLPTPLSLSEPFDADHALASVHRRLVELELGKALHESGRQQPI